MNTELDGEIMNMPGITVVLNAFKRTKYLEQQLNAIKAQTIKPTRILVWQNAGDVIPTHLLSSAVFAQCNQNLGVWARFAYALNSETEYICVFDDDTIPGSKWFENCLQTMQTNEGLLGTRGLRFMSKGRYYPSIGVGWDAPNEQVERVDIVGHSWFFKREWLASFWRELPPITASKIAGEDIHFSYVLQKYLGLNTYVPPHPLDDIEMWGSLPETGKYIGGNEVAISSNPEALSRFNKAISHYCDLGFELCLSAKERAQVGIVIGSGIRSNIPLRRWLGNHPRLFVLAKKVLVWLRAIKIHI